MKELTPEIRVAGARAQFERLLLQVSKLQVEVDFAKHEMENARAWHETATQKLDQAKFAMGDALNALLTEMAQEHAQEIGG